MEVRSMKVKILTGKMIVRSVVTIFGLLISYNLTLAFRDGWSNASKGGLASNNLLLYSGIIKYLFVIFGLLLFEGGYEVAKWHGLLNTNRGRRLCLWLAYLPLAMFTSIDIGLQATWSEAIFMLVLVMLTVSPALSFLLTYVFTKTGPVIKSTGRTGVQH